MKLFLGMIFIILRNVEVEFSERKFIWRTYTLIEALSTA